MDYKKFKCSRCKGNNFYKLNDGRLKCKKCHKRFTPYKSLHVKKILQVFCDNLTVQQAHQKLKISQPTIQKYYTLFRQQLILHSKKIYHEKSEHAPEYDEWRYKKNNIIAFVIDGSVYTLLFHTQNITYDKLHKVSHHESFESPLGIFWNFLENYMKKYHGVDNKYFVEYLKEVEFMFNTPHSKRYEILKSLLHL